MATLGPNDLKQYALPSYWDAAELSKQRLEDGSTYEAYISDVTAALAQANAGLLSHPLISSLISITTDPALEYQTGVSNGFQVATEYSRPDGKRGATTGHMLPLIAYDRGLSWTWMFLQKARRVQLDSDIAAVMQDLKNIWSQKILTRLFKETYDAVGSAGRSMPLADGGTADSTNYVPPAYPDRGGSFVYTHDHITPLDGIKQSTLETAVKNVWEHGHDSPFDLLIAEADISSWVNTVNVTGYIPRADPLLRYGVTQDIAQVGSDYIGAIETDYGAVRIRATGRIPTTFWAVYKSYGPLDQRNPLRVRYNPKFGVGAVLLAGDHIREYPLENAILWMEFGVGVGADRCAAVVAKNTAGSYSDPTIT
jgi:hypothetical protein